MKNWTGLSFPKQTIKRSGGLKELTDRSAFYGVGLVVHGASFSQHPTYTFLKNRLPATTVFYQHEGGEPTLKQVRELLVLARQKEIDYVVGIGGGSVMDLTKAVGGLVNVSRDPQTYQEGAVVEAAGIPFIAVPTTAGTGAEVTMNAVIINEKTQEKLSIRHPSFMAELVFLDPELMMNLPASVVAHSGMDAITQAIESYISRQANWLTEEIALQGFTLLTSHLKTVFLKIESGNKPDIDELERLLEGSYLAGIALANSRLGVIHGVAHPLGSYYDIPHGLVCAICLIPSLKLNRPFIGKKYEVLSKLLGEDLIAYLDALKTALKIENIFLEKPLTQKDRIIDYTLSSGSTKANPKEIKIDDVELILRQVFEG